MVSVSILSDKKEAPFVIDDKGIPLLTPINKIDDMAFVIKIKTK
ncbi:MAG: hypothetical protein OEM04_05180 [Flavobacteriaceae bacterium]|nr:hypothetical protein [Flavobacteriaceae bacterium]